MKYKGYLIDLDGTIYLGDKLIPEGKEFIDNLNEANIPYLFVTNNTTKTPKDVQKRLAELFNIKVKEDVIYTASLATVDYMRDKKLGETVYVIGESGLKEEIYSAGFTETSNNPAYVVVGLDTEITYEKLTIATLAIRNGAHFIGTNPDKNIPTNKGLLPGAGSLISLLETSTQTRATIVGKPKSFIMEKALERLGLTHDEVIMVGDNYETDIKSGIDNDIDTLLVLTGFTRREELTTLEVQPTFICNTLAEWEF